MQKQSITKAVTFSTAQVNGVLKPSNTLTPGKTPPSSGKINTIVRVPITIQTQEAIAIKFGGTL